MKTKLLRAAAVILCVAMVFSLAACSSGKIESKSDKLRIVCTLFVPYDFVREIAGDRVDLTLLLPPGMESHSYDPTPADMKAVSNADLLIRVGENMETWSAKLFDKSTGAGEYLDIASEMGLRLAAHEHEHEHHHHHHHHEGGETEEYGIGTFVYYRRPAFDIHKFDHYVATKWPRSVIRAKGVCYFSHNRDMSFLFEQAGIQKKITEAGQWYATAPEEDMIELMRQEPGLLRDWDEQYGDRMLKIVFIGQNMDKEQIIRDLDKCLE